MSVLHTFKFPLQTQHKRISIKNAHIKECEKDDKLLVISIETPSRTFFLNFDNELIRDEWLQALFTVKIESQRHSDNSQACIIQ